MRFSSSLGTILLSLAVFATAEAAREKVQGVNPVEEPCPGAPASVVEKMDFLTFYPSEVQANSAASEIDVLLFNVEVRTAAASPEWVVRAAYRELPTPEQHAEHVTVMKRIADRHGSKDHGYGCSSGLFRR